MDLKPEPETPTKRGVKSIQCRTCGTSCGTKALLTRHMLTHGKPWNCSVCGKQFTQNSNLQAHMVAHSGEKPFQCSVCGKHFAYKNYLKPHMETHSEVRPWKCSLCPQAYSRKSGLKIHTRSHLEPQILPYHCPTCPDRSFRTRQSLSKHMRCHKVLECSVCGQSFPELTVLKAHLGTHAAAQQLSPSPTFACSTCGQGFGTKGSLNHHARIEGHGRSRSSESEAPLPPGTTYACHLCCEQFPERGGLNKHLMGHSDEDPALQCEACNSGFRTLILLTKHLRTSHMILGL